jgi:hypothetical protein
MRGDWVISALAALVLLGLVLLFRSCTPEPDPGVDVTEEAAMAVEAAIVSMLDDYNPQDVIVELEGAESQGAMIDWSIDRYIVVLGQLHELSWMVDSLRLELARCQVGGGICGD